MQGNIATVTAGDGIAGHTINHFFVPKIPVKAGGMGLHAGLLPRECRVSSP